jgi:tRNA A-37 threonylcarbamoyl transferase component Bud32
MTHDLLFPASFLDDPKLYFALLQTLLVVFTNCQGEILAQHLENLDKGLIDRVIEFSRHVAGSSQITAAYEYYGEASGLAAERAAVEVLLVIRDFQSKLMSYVKVIDEKTVIVAAVDKWVFERDVDRGFLGEALAWGLIFPYSPMINGEYLHQQEVKIKKRLILELMENLVLEFPELSFELRIKPEYFMFEVMMGRARIFPPMINNLGNFMREDSREERVNHTLRGYLEALEELEEEGTISLSKGYVRMSREFVENAQNPRVRLMNLSKNVPRALFTSALRIFPRILNALSQNREVLLNLQRATEVNSKSVCQIEIPEKYVYAPTASGLVSLANRTDIEAFAREVLHADKNAEITTEPVGGILNDVFLVKAYVQGKERKVIVKRFKDWSSVKWFPLTLWSAGTRTFAVLGRSRLERECAINQVLYSKGFDVPRLLHVSPNARLVFMDYVEGENASKTVKRLAEAKTAADTKKGLKIIERIGRKFAKVHALGIALGDTKPENILIGEHSEIYLMDFEQASRNGDKAWDVAEFLYYAGHDLPPLVETRTAELIAEAFIEGYVAAGGGVEVVRKAGNPKYTKVFSVFTFPHVMLAMSNVCRRAGGSKQ